MSLKDELMKPVENAQRQAWEARRLLKLYDQLVALLSSDPELKVLIVHDSIVIIHNREVDSTPHQ